MQLYLISFFVLALISAGCFLVYDKRGNGFAALAVSLGAALVASGVLYSGIQSEMADTEVWNGQIISKTRDEVGCRHSYSCRCKRVCSGSGKNRSCSTECDTCYEHNHDVDWNLRTTLGTIRIDGVSRQGLAEPPRWTVAKVGDPVSDTHHFTNYIKGARENVFNRNGTKVTYTFPTYPSGIYDYYKIDRAIGNLPNIKDYSREIPLALRTLGPSKQVNLIIVFTTNPEDYADQLEAHWLGGKKNDVIVVIGQETVDKAKWVKVISWTKQEYFKVAVRDAVLPLPLSDAKLVVGTIAANIQKSFVRRSMKEFEYLEYDIEPSFGFIIASFLAFFSIIGTYIFVRRIS